VSSSLQYQVPLYILLPPRDDPAQQVQVFVYVDGVIRGHVGISRTCERYPQGPQTQPLPSPAASPWCPPSRGCAPAAAPPMHTTPATALPPQSAGCLACAWLLLRAQLLDDRTAETRDQGSRRDGTCVRTCVCVCV